MAIAIIDDLEVVDIDEKDGSCLVRVSLHPIYDALQTFQKQGPVRKSGERIMGSIKDQLFLSAFSFRYIAGVVNDAADIFVFSQVSNNTLEIEPPAVRMSQPELN